MRGHATYTGCGIEPTLICYEHIHFLGKCPECSLMETLNDSYADHVMGRDNSPIPANSLAKENATQGFAISPARFNFKPNINVSTPLPVRPPMQQRQSHAPGLSLASSVRHSPPVPQRLSHATGSLASMFGQSPPMPQRLSHATGGGRGGLTRTFPINAL